MQKKATIGSLKLAFVVFVFLCFLAGVFFPFFLFAQSTDEAKSQLRAKLQALQAEINNYRQKIQAASKTEQSLKGQINVLEAKIKRLNLEIESLHLSMQDAQRRISVIKKTTAEIEKNISRERQALSSTIMVVYENDKLNYVEIFFQKKKLSEIFADVKAIQELQASLLTSLSEIRDLKGRLEEEKQRLEDREEDLAQLKKAQEIQTLSLNRDKRAKKMLLARTQSQKSQLLTKVNVSQATIEQIREQLYQLEGMGVSLKFGDALAYAQKATTKTGVRAALLLAMLKKESEWGMNVGTGNWKNDMHPRDHDAFLRITKELGMDPDTTPVSRKPSYGWGGAMGPAQFLPNTWLAYEDEIARLTGHRPPNPWNIEDAFMACAIKLRDAGAAAQTYNAEWKAAQIYFAGRRWNNPRYYFYGDSVMELAGHFQKQINVLERGN